MHRIVLAAALVALIPALACADPAAPPPNMTATAPLAVSPSGSSYAPRVLSWDRTAAIPGYLANVVPQAGTAYTLAATDCGTLIPFTAATAVTVTLPNSLPTGCEVALAQKGAGKVSVSAAAGATLLSPHSYTGTFAQGSVIGVSVDANVGGAAADYLFTGDGS